jgi:putative nucleotidyltransferase with HDIG domain
MIRWFRNVPMLVRSVLFVTVAVVTVLALFAYLGSDALDNSTIRSNAIDRQSASLTAAVVSTRLEDLHSLLDAWRDPSETRLPGSPGTQSQLGRMRESSTALRQVFLINPDGLVAASDPGMSAEQAQAVQTDPAVADVRRTGSFILGNFFPAREDGAIRMLMISPRKAEDGSSAGWIGAVVDVSQLVATGFSELSGRTAENRVFLIDSAGQAVGLDPSGRLVLEPVSYALKLLPLLEAPEAESRITKSENEGVVQDVVIAFAPASGGRLGVVIEQSAETVYSALYQLRWQFVIFGAVTLAMAFLLTGIEDWLILSPIRELLKATRRMTAGDLTTPLKIVGRDETSALAREFEVMRLRLADWSGELSAAVERQTRKLSTLYAIDRVASTTLELHEVLTESLQRVLELLQMDAGGFFLESDGGLALQIHGGIPDDLACVLERLRTREGAVGIVTVEKRVILLKLHADSDDPLAPPLRKAGFRTMITIPLVAKGMTLGGLVLLSQSDRELAAGDLDLMESIGQQIGGALHNAQLYASEMKRREEAERLYEAARVVGGSLSLREVCERILQELQRVVPYDQATVQWLEGDRLTVIGAHGYPEGETIVGLSCEAGADSPVREAMTSSQPVIVEDLRRSASGSATEGPDAAGMQSWLGVPMRYSERLIGLIVLEKAEGAFYTREQARQAGAFATQVAAAMENARLFTTLAQNLARISSLYELGAEIISASLPQDAARAVALKVAQAANAHSAVVTMIDPGGNVYLRVGADRNSVLPLEPPPRPNGVTMRVFRSGRNLIAAEPDPEQAMVTPRLLAAGVQAMIGLPLHTAERVIGTLFVRYAERHEFSDDEVRALTTFANTAATALERSRLLEETERRLEEVGALYDLSSVLRESLSLEEMLPRILQKALTMARADAASISLIEGADVVCRAAEGFDPELIGRRVPLGEGVIGGVAAGGELRHTPFVPSDPMVAPPTGPMAVVRGVGGALCIPLRTADSVVGAILAVSYSRSQFRESEIHLLTAAADIAGGAIHRIMILEQLEHRVHELGSLYEFGTAVSTSLRLEDVVRLALRAGPLAVHAETCSLFLWDDVDESLVLWESNEKNERTTGRVKYRAGEGLIGWVFLEGKPALVPDVTQDPRWKPDPEVETLIVHSIRDVVAVPLIRGRKVLGVMLAVNRRGGGAFSASDQSLLSALAGQTAIAIENAMLFEDVRDLSVDAISSLATAIDARDPYTRGHSEDVTHLVVDLARELGWQGSDLEMIEFAALLHDVGKIAVPDNILRKPNVLVPEEWDVIYLHPYHSAQIVRQVEPLRRIIPWIYHHHERWDGTGYPDRLKGEAIPEGARIIAIVDAYNAITTDRPYHKALSDEEAQAEIARSTGSQFDPDISQVFLRMLQKPGGR